MLSLVALVLPTAFGFLVCRRAWPPQFRSRAGSVLQASVGLGLGLGLASLVYFAALLAGGTPGGWYPWVEGGGFALASVALAAAARSHPPAPAPAHSRPEPFLWFAAGAAAAAGLSFLVGYLVYNAMVPHGINDSIMFWNLRARFLFRGGDHWRDAFGPMYIAPDYPLLLPATIARCWAYDGRESLHAPALVAFAFAAATLGALVSGVALFRGRTQGALAGVVLLGTTYYFETTAMLVADVPIGLYYLACPALLYTSDRAGGWRGAAALAGAAAGFAAWTKNDGQLFVLAVAGVRLGWAVRGRAVRGFVRETGPFLVGVLVALSALIAFKIAVAPESDFVTGQGSDTTLARLQNPDRYFLIARTFVSDLLGLGPGLIPLLAVYAVLVGPAAADRRAGAGQWFLLVGLMLVGYAGVYLITPHDLKWRLDTSFDRLRMQLWPLALFAFFLWTATPAESLRAVGVISPPLPPPPPPPAPPPPVVPKAESSGGFSGLPRFRGGD